MVKKFLALMIFLLMFSSGTSHAANYYDSDIFHIHTLATNLLSQDTTSTQYIRYGNGDIDFFYQLRDITGETHSDRVGGPQWFATVYENYSKLYPSTVTPTNTTTTTTYPYSSRGLYRRTLGGQIDDIKVSVIGDILDGFNFVFAEEPQPYEVWLNRSVIASNDYDRYPDPLETLCIVTTNGTAKLNLDFANPFARHFPFWWNYTTTANARNWRWWRNNYNWRDTGFYTVEPIAYIYDPSNEWTYTRDTYGQYTQKFHRLLRYHITTSHDVTSAALGGVTFHITTVYDTILNDGVYSVVSSSDTIISGDNTVVNVVIPENTSDLYPDMSTGTKSQYGYYITDTGSKILYRTSGDISGNYSIISGDRLITNDSGTVLYDSAKVMCQVSGDAIYDADKNLLYTVETALGGDSCKYICAVRNIYESIVVHGFDDYDYAVRISPNSERSVASQQALNASINIIGEAGNYGSRLGYITFRQRASFTSGYENYREASPIPLIIANVSNGNAADNPLIFDMTITDPDNNGRVVKRIKFKWDAQQDRPNQDLGTFFMMDMLNDYSDKNYNIETKITNRTGTRYMLYRYDRAIPGSGTLTNTTLPKYWKYDLTEDVYGTLPQRFLLDAHSQIAPGLVTVYDETLDMTKDTTASFRLYEYNYTNPKDLWLNYKRVAGMVVNGAPVNRRRPDFSTSANTKTEVVASDDAVTVQGFTMYFTDISGNEDQTAREIQSLTGKTPEMVNIALSAIQPYSVYINSAAMNEVAISHDVPDDLKLRVSYDEVKIPLVEIKEEDTETQSGDTKSKDIPVRIEYNTDTSNKMAVHPIAIRMKIPRNSQLLKDIWDDLDSAEDSRTLFNTFSKVATVWVRSAATSEYDADLFKAVNNKGSSLGVTASDCVSAFIYEDNLYLDFMVFMADAVSKNSAKTAFVEIFKDDNVPYILIGDGAIDRAWNLSFYVSSPRAEAGSSSSGSSTSSGATTYATGDTGSSGGGCNLMRNEGLGMRNYLILLLLALGLVIKQVGIRD